MGVSILKRALIGKVDISELKSYLSAMNEDIDETGASVEPIRCLCCGARRKNLTGVLDSQSARKIPAPTSSRVVSDGNPGNVCFVYGERGDVYYGRTGNTKSFISKPEENSDK